MSMGESSSSTMASSNGVTLFLSIASRSTGMGCLSPGDGTTLISIRARSAIEHPDLDAGRARLRPGHPHPMLGSNSSG